jgi:polysaccharide pyruvyl transferase WcaK-like protein
VQTRVTFLGHFGAGNLGNECTLQAAIQQISSYLPRARLQCACTFPDDVRKRHNIPAYHWKRVPSSSLGTERGATAVDRRRPTVFVRIFQELASLAICLRILRRSDVLVVCGTNLVSDYLTGPKAWPYDLFKWSVLATLCRTKVLYLGVGVGPIYHPISRWLIKHGLGSAYFRSYRDETSKRYAVKIGVNVARDIVCPDLVFGLSPRSLIPNRVRTKLRPVIGVGLKNYGADSDSRAECQYKNYVDTMVAFICWLREHGYDVRLLLGDFCYDTQVRQDVVAALEEQSGAHGEVLADPALTVQDLIGHIAETDAVVSPRFHSLVLGLMLNKPIIALTDHHKLDSLMAAFGLADYCLPLDNLRVQDVTNLFLRIKGDSSRLKPHIEMKVAESRAAVDDQYVTAFAKAGILTESGPAASEAKMG